jgi:hypothetical protein
VLFAGAFPECATIEHGVAPIRHRARQFRAGWNARDSRAFLAETCTTTASLQPDFSVLLFPHGAIARRFER